MEVDLTPSTRTSQKDASSTTASASAASSAATASVSVALHPLVIMNISEHWTRTKAQEGKPTQVYGAIIGRQKGREIEVMNSFELDYNIIEGQVIIDRDYYALKESQFKQVFSDMDFLGWYSTASQPPPQVPAPGASSTDSSAQKNNSGQPTEADVLIHRQICEIHESPLFLQLNPLARNTGELPVSMYESVIDLVPSTSSAEAGAQAVSTENQTRMLFVKVPYTLATEDAERIGLDHVARINGSDTTTSASADPGSGTADIASIGQSKVAEHLVVQHSAIKMLAARVRLVLQYVKAVESGELPMNHDIMREAKALADRLPVLETEAFKPEFYTQCNDGALIAYLGTIMKSCNNLLSCINKFNVLYQRQGTGRRMRGIFF